jgi:hypothetical protein
MLGLRRAKDAPQANSLKQPENDTDTVELRGRIAHLERAIKLLDYDLQDAVDGFYRRRQSDRMREIRDEDAPKRKRTTDRDILMRALQLSDDRRPKNDSDDSHSATSD